MREELGIQNVFHLHLASGPGGPAVDVTAHPAHGRLLCLNIGGFVDGLVDNGVECVVSTWAQNQLNDVLICNHAEGPEEDPQGNLGLDAWHCCTEQVNLGILGVVHDLDRIGLGNLIIVWSNRLDFNDLHLLVGIPVVAEDDGAIL